MNDFEYDVKQKKALARNAIHRKGGSRSKKCSLPSDRMTKAEWKRRNGEIMSYDMSKPLSWKEWKSMPDDLQLEYIHSLREKFPNIQRKMIAADLFCVTPTVFAQEMKRLGEPGKHGGRQAFPKEAVIEDWMRWILGENAPSCLAVEPEPEPVSKPVPEPEYKVPKAQLSMMEFHICGANLQIENALLEVIRMLPINEYNVSLKVWRKNP